MGEPTDYINADGEDTDLYDAQLYLLVFGCKDAATARTAAEDWLRTERNTYNVLSEEQTVCNGQEYTLLDYEVVSEANPFHRGAAAFCVYENYTVSAELACVEDFRGDPVSILQRFLEGCHYSSQLLK